MMAFTFSNIRRRSLGDRKSVLADVTVSTTGIGTFSPLSVGLHRVEAVNDAAADTVTTQVDVVVQNTSAGATHTLVIRLETDGSVTTEGEYRIEFVGW
jgi:hypothetical protein